MSDDQTLSSLDHYAHALWRESVATQCGIFPSICQSIWAVWSAEPIHGVVELQASYNFIGKKSFRKGLINFYGL